MTFLSALGEFPEMVLALAFSFGCALLLGFVCLRFLLGLMSRQQYSVGHDHNGIDDPSRLRSILWLGPAVAGTSPAVAGTSGSSVARADDDGGSSAIGGPYLLPAAAPLSRFARDSKLDIASSARVVELPQAVAGRIAQSGSGDVWGGDNGGAA